MEQDATTDTPRGFLGPWPCRLDHALAVLWFLGFLAAASNVGMALTHFMALFFSGLVLAGIWGLRALASILRAYGGAPRRHRGWKEWMAWLVLPAAFVLGIGLASLNIPFRLRFALSETALRAAEEPGRAGLFRVLRIHRRDGCTFLTTGKSFLDEYGLVHAPGGEPPESWHHGYCHLTGGWWTYVVRD